MQGCKECRLRDARRRRAALSRRRYVVALMLVAAFLVFVTGLWSTGVTGDVKLGIAGVGLAVCVLGLAFEAEGS